MAADGLQQREGLLSLNSSLERFPVTAEPPPRHGLGLHIITFHEFSLTHAPSFTEVVSLYVSYRSQPNLIPGNAHCSPLSHKDNRGVVAPVLKSEIAFACCQTVDGNHVAPAVVDIYVVLAQTIDVVLGGGSGLCHFSRMFRLAQSLRKVKLPPVTGIQADRQ